MAKLRPFRQIDEHDVIKLFAYSGTLPVTQGTLVRPVASGWRSDESDTEFLGNVVGAGYGNTVSQRYGTIPRVTAADTGEATIGMLLYDVKETDENGELYILHPRKADENDVVMSGQVAPILTRGIVLWSGTLNGPNAAGRTFWASGAGHVTTTNTNQISGTSVGRLLGSPDSRGYALLYVNVV